MPDTQRPKRMFRTDQGAQLPVRTDGVRNNLYRGVNDLPPRQQFDISGFGALSAPAPALAPAPSPEQSGFLRFSRGIEIPPSVYPVGPGNPAPASISAQGPVPAPKIPTLSPYYGDHKTWQEPPTGVDDGFKPLGGDVRPFNYDKPGLASDGIPPRKRSDFPDFTPTTSSTQAPIVLPTGPPIALPDPSFPPALTIPPPLPLPAVPTAPAPAPAPAPNPEREPFVAEQLSSPPAAPAAQPEVPMYEAGFDDPMTVEGTKLKFKVLRDWGDNIAPDGSGLPSSRAPHTYRPIETVDTQAQLDALKPHTPYVTKHGKFGMTGAAVPKAPNASAPQTAGPLDTRYTMEPSTASRPAEMERAPLTGDDYHRTGRRFGEAVGDYGRPMVSVYPQGNANELMNRFNTANTQNASIRDNRILTFVNDEEDYTKLPPGAVYMSPGGVGKKGTGTGYIDMRGQFQPLKYSNGNAGGVIAGEIPVSGGDVPDQTLQETRRLVTQGYNVPGQGTGVNGPVKSEQFTVVSTEEARRKLPLGTVYITPSGTMAIRGTGQVTLDANGYLVVTTRPSENKVSELL